MDEIKNLIDDLGVEALENNIKIASIAILSDKGDLVYQTENWDLSDQTNTIINVIKGAHSFILSDIEYSVVGTTINGFIGSNNKGTGYILFIPFQGGVLVSYAMPQADPSKALTFLRPFTNRLNGKV
jgi:hypothetical protein